MIFKRFDHIFMGVWIVFLVMAAMSLAGCTKSHDFLITAHDLCTHLEDKQDLEQIRDKHDECLLFKGEELLEKPLCKEHCQEFCTDKKMSFQTSWPDFSGCHCTCNQKVEMPNK